MNGYPLSELTPVSLPFLPQRVALINPTKFLGNLLLAGGLMQQYCDWCNERGVRLLIVLDERYRQLFSPLLPGAEKVFYPRDLLESGRGLQAIRAYGQCVTAIRRFRADLAFFLDEDSVSHRLTHFSGARFRLSTTAARYRFGFHAVLPVDRVKHGQDLRHIWYSYKEIFQTVGMDETGEPGYAQLGRQPLLPELVSRLVQSGVNFERPLAVLHAGATKAYKRWPLANFIATAKGLSEEDYQILLIGAGAVDEEANSAIAAQCPSIDLCNRLNLSELAALLGCATAVVANDSGPFHLASAMGVPGVVIFGPTDPELWRPLSSRSVVLENRALCDSACTRTACLKDYMCIKSVKPEHVLCIIRQWKNHAGHC